MFKNTRKLWYSIGAIAIIVALSVLAYQSDLTDKLTGQLKLRKPPIHVIQPEPSPYLTHGQFVIKVFAYMQKTQCAEDLCPQMSGHRPEEVAHCNLQARGVFGPRMPGYDWYDSLINKAEAMKIIVDAFDLPQVTDLHILPYRDLKTKQKPWYFDYVLTGYGNDLISDNKDHLFGAKDPVTKEWLKEILSRIEPMEECPNALHRGELVIKIWNNMQEHGCTDQCTDMTGGMPEEVAVCNLEQYGIAYTQVSYDWFVGLVNRAETIRLIVNSIDGLAGYEAPSTPTFNDVPADAWYFDYVEAAVQLDLVQGYVDNNGNLTGLFGPGDIAEEKWADDVISKITDNPICSASCYIVNRAELAKEIILAIDGLADYEAPSTPTFNDVAADAWYFDYVEAAVQLGIVSGYTDAAGNLTGMFGPGDIVHRASFIKIIVNSFDVPTTLIPASPFIDVPESTWFHDYVVTAVNNNLIIPNSAHLFYPANNLDECFLEEVLARI